MALTDLIKSTAQAEDKDAAYALAAALNADQTMRGVLTGRKEFSAADVIRLGKNILSYSTTSMPKVADLDTVVRERGFEAVSGALGVAAE